MNEIVGKTCWNWETGLGWDAAKGTNDASEEWWEAKIQEDPEVAKFREQGPKHLHELEILFRGIVVTGFAAYASFEGSRESEGYNMGAEGIHVDDINNDDIEEQERMHETEMGVTTQPTSSSKEKGQSNRPIIRGRIEVFNHYHSSL